LAGRVLAKGRRGADERRGSGGAAAERAGMRRGGRRRRGFILWVVRWGVTVQWRFKISMELNERC
jgi:hypothetical protein